MLKEISHRELQLIQLDILKYIHGFCENLGLTYYLCGGTLLGAVRHKGFIPWDDDVDIFMPRKDYDKLIKALMTSDESPYKLKSIHNKGSNYYYPFVKISDNRTRLVENGFQAIEIGVNIDIFPIDGLPSNRLLLELHLLKLKFFRGLLTTSVQEKCKSTSVLKSLVKYPFWLCTRLANPKVFSQWIDSIASRYSFQESQFVACLVWGYGKREIVHSKVFADPVKLKFEDGEFNAPIGYQIYLTCLYGDYMQLPPEDRRIPPHDNFAYWR